MRASPTHQGSNLRAEGHPCHPPHALAAALREGRLGVMDYYTMKNIMADTQMRETIAKPEKK